MNRIMIVRRLRMAFAAFCGVLAALFVVLWVRSYKYSDELSITTKIRLTRMDSNYGKLLFATEIPIMGNEKFVEKWGLWVGDALPNVIIPPMPEYSAIGFTVATSGVEGEGFAIGAPYWFPTATFALLAAISYAPWLHFRFTLRTLLLTTTLVAVVLGLAVWARS